VADGADIAQRSDSPATRLKRAFHWSRPLQVAAMMLADAVIVAMGVALAYFVRFEGVVPEQFLAWVLPAIGVAVAAMLAALWLFGLYHVVLRYVGIDVMARLAGAVFSAMVFFFVFDIVVQQLSGERLVPYGVIIAGSAFAFIGLAVLRSLGRLWVVMTGAGTRGDHRVLIIGAGDAGSLLLRDIENQPQLGYNVVGFLDDMSDKHHMMVRGVRVVGPIDAITDVVESLRVDEVLVAIPSMGSERRREVLEMCTRAGVPTRMISGIAADAVTAGLADLRPVQIEDLLGREPNEIDVELISETLTGKVVAVTGAAGSIGSELCRQIAKMRPRKLVLMEIDESRLYELWLEMEKSWPGVSVMRICDIRDKRKITRVFCEEKPDVVFHAAAYKHVPIMEGEPCEAVRANVLGTINTVMAGNEAGAERFVLISTDKAVEPRNVMGATKRVAELVMLAAARHGIGAIAVRFGNVLGSRGSVVPIFEEQLRKGGPITVTDPDVTRYFMTIPEAARLVLQAQAMSSGGDVFVLDMGVPVRITDLAQRMIVLSGVPCQIEFTGLRPGEKMHEILVHADGDLLETECPAVRQLNLLPVPGDGFSDRVRDMLWHAQRGRDDDVKQLLAEIAGARFGAEADGVPSQDV